MEFTPHSFKQDDLIHSDYEYTAAATGTQWGKSISAALWMKRQIHTFTEADSNFLVLSPTYPILEQSALPYVMNAMRGMGKYKDQKKMIELGKGRRLYFRTERDPDSIVGIPNVKAAWIDEAGKLRLYFWENYLARKASAGARTLLTTSPYSLNWFYQQFIKPYKENKLDANVTVIQAASWDNPYHLLSVPEKREELRSRMDPRRFNMLFGGEWGKMSGLVYDCFDDDQNITDPFPLPPECKYYAGIDWGFSPDPFVLKIRAVTPDGRHYQISEFYKLGMTIMDMIDVAKQKKALYPIKQFYCDPSQPGYIEEFNRAGLSAVGADNDINRGIGLHYELIKSRKYKIFRGTSPHTLDELEVYHYPEPIDLKPDQDAKDVKPVKQNDHCLDVDRYLTISLYRVDLRRAPKLPESQINLNDRLKHLKRSRGSLPGSEDWS